MSKKFRDWLFIAFIALFIITTFFVSLYAAGYTLNRQWPPRFNQLFQKTGMLVLDSEPSGADIFINDIEQRRPVLLDLGRDNITTPTKIKNLPPGEYNLRLEKDGYWPLEKKIYINSGQSTFAEDFILFKKSLPLNLTICAPQAVSLSPDKKNLILPNDGLVINLKTEISSNLKKIASTTSVQWSKNSDQILWGNDLINLSGEKSGYNLKALGQEAQNFFWDENNKKIYYQSGGNISCVLTDKNTISTILSGSDYVAYTVRDDLIYTVEKQNHQNYLRVYDASSAILKSSSDLPNGEYQFHQDEYSLNLYDKKQHALYLINASSPQPIVRQVRPVVSWQWLSNNFLVWHNEFEIYSLDIDNNRQELLIRVSEPITGIAWSRANNYLIYASSQQIQIVNLGLDKRTPIALLKAEQITSIFLDEKNQLLYFYAQIGQQAGIYKLQLQ